MEKLRGLGVVSIESVATNPNLFLGAVTVMFRREPGYDAENQESIGQFRAAAAVT